LRHRHLIYILVNGDLTCFELPLGGDDTINHNGIRRHIELNPTEVKTKSQTDRLGVRFLDRPNEIKAGKRLFLWDVTDKVLLCICQLLKRKGGGRDVGTGRISGEDGGSRPSVWCVATDRVSHPTQERCESLSAWRPNLHHVDPDAECGRTVLPGREGHRYQFIVVRDIVPNRRIDARRSLKAKTRGRHEVDHGGERGATGV